MKNSRKADRLSKIISAFLMLLIFLWLAGHISGAVAGGISSGDVLRKIWEHICAGFFDCFYFNKFIFIYALGVWFVGALSIFTARTLPHADMKGKEKGSNDFNSSKELEEFLKHNTTKVR